ncbi:hypothetical protein Ae406Ps2_3449 [Pseudonocardia sp. Ae406_Ps2]|nr:hypothetical protein Ae331Ps2_2479c [Pseudonocardia sp. Ae331_Ps2]OLM03449.1 hypothetical protein Ae406Ps2_3449 [Pseudonocardia sp. Ae406_Ps2]OLM11670.1 hypothetical protein Ae505Ps2_1795c [Pseudonocardia sp. Ae505_Ps2]OLM25007.1 hypothetical protein Ae706Ps2_3440 [Pseudonocardia sp. Ae706_Ps2]
MSHGSGAEPSRRGGPVTGEEHVRRTDRPSDGMRLGVAR